LGYTSRCICGPDHDEATGFRIWERAQQDSVNDAKDGRIGADAERERYHSYGRESRTLSKRTEAEPDVAPERLQQRNSSAIPIRFLSGLDSAERQERVAPGLLETHATAEILLDMHLQMAFEFSVKLAVASPFVGQSAQADQQNSYCSHKIFRSEFKL